MLPPVAFSTRISRTCHELAPWLDGGGIPALENTRPGKAGWDVAYPQTQHQTPAPYPAPVKGEVSINRPECRRPQLSRKLIPQPIINIQIEIKPPPRHAVHLMRLKMLNRHEFCPRH